MFQWANFEAAAPLLAAHGRELIERFRFVLVGTIRSDGTPRISPVEAHIVRGHLMLVMIRIILTFGEGMSLSENLQMVSLLQKPFQVEKK